MTYVIIALILLLPYAVRIRFRSRAVRGPTVWL